MVYGPLTLSLSLSLLHTTQARTPSLFPQTRHPPPYTPTSIYTHTPSPPHHHTQTPPPCKHSEHTQPPCPLQEYPLKREEEADLLHQINLFSGNDRRGLSSVLNSCAVMATAPPLGTSCLYLLFYPGRYFIPASVRECIFCVRCHMHSAWGTFLNDVIND